MIFINFKVYIHSIINVRFPVIGNYVYICSTTIQSYAVLSLSIILSSVQVEGYPFNIYYSPRYGKSGGHYFNDYHSLSSSSIVGIDKIYVHYTSNDVLAIQMTYRDSKGTCSLGYYHGEGTPHGGSDAIISLSSYEYLSRITGKYETTIRYLVFEIKNSISGRTRSYGYGLNRGQHFTISGPIYGIHGHSGNRLDNLGVFLPNPTYGPYGHYSGGTGFWDPVLTYRPAISRLYKVCIRHGAEIDAIQLTYLTTSGTYYTTGRYGGSGGSESCFTLGTNERIATVQIHRHQNVAKYKLINALKFTISTKNSHRQYTCGPYGQQNGDSAIYHTRNGALGFFGHYTSTRLTALGIIGH